MDGERLKPHPGLGMEIGIRCRIDVDKPTLTVGFGNAAHGSAHGQDDQVVPGRGVSVRWVRLGAAPTIAKVPGPRIVVAIRLIGELDLERLPALSWLSLEIGIGQAVDRDVIVLRSGILSPGPAYREGRGIRGHTGSRRSLFFRTEGNARLRRGVSPYPDILVINIRRLTTVSIVAEHKPVEIASKVIQHQSVALPVPSTTVTIMIVPPPVLGPIYPVKPGARK